MGTMYLDRLGLVCGLAHSKLPHLGNAGKGVHRQLPHLGDAGTGVVSEDDLTSDTGARAHLIDYMRELAGRLRGVRVCCGNWDRVCGPCPTVKLGTTGVFLDPPYADEADRQSDLYSVDSGSVAHEVRRWAVENGDDPRLRIALCDYGEASGDFPSSWERIQWKASGGYGSQSASGRGRENSSRETIWFSPHCLHPNAMLFFVG